MSIERRITTVTTPATTFDLTTLIDVKGDLNLTSASGIETARLARLISQCSALAATYCNRVFAKQTYRDTFRDVSGETLVTLKHFPLVSISAITVDDDAALTAADYESDIGNGFVYALDGDDNRSEWSGNKVVIDYVAGFVLPGMTGTRTLPLEIENAIIREISSRRVAASRDSALRSVSIPGVIDKTYWVGDPGNVVELSPDVQGILDYYRVPVIA